MPPVTSPRPYPLRCRLGAVSSVCDELGVPTRRSGYHLRTRQDLGGVLKLARCSERMRGHAIGEDLPRVGSYPVSVSLASFKLR